MNNFEVIKTPIKDLVIIQPKVFGDERGFFLETYNKKSFEEHGLTMEFLSKITILNQKRCLERIIFSNKIYSGKISKSSKRECL